MSSASPTCRQLAGRFVEFVANPSRRRAEGDAN
jgi:hypothetical protein